MPLENEALPFPLGLKAVKPTVETPCLRLSWPKSARLRNCWASVTSLAATDPEVVQWIGMNPAIAVSARQEGAGDCSCRMTPGTATFALDRGNGRELPPETRTQPMQHGHRPAASEQIPATLVPEKGWHFLHLFYRVDRARLAA